MTYIILGYPLVFWIGILTFISLMTQIALGYYLTHGYPSTFKYHKINAGILIILVFIHAILALSIYF